MTTLSSEPRLVAMMWEEKRNRKLIIEEPALVLKRGPAEDDVRLDDQ